MKPRYRKLSFSAASSPWSWNHIFASNSQKQSSQTRTMHNRTSLTPFVDDICVCSEFIFLLRTLVGFKNILSLSSVLSSLFPVAHLLHLGIELSSRFSFADSRSQSQDVSRRLIQVYKMLRAILSGILPLKCSLHSDRRSGILTPRSHTSCPNVSRHLLASHRDICLLSLILHIAVPILGVDQLLLFN